MNGLLLTSDRTGHITSWSSPFLVSLNYPQPVVVTCLRIQNEGNTIHFLVDTE